MAEPLKFPISFDLKKAVKDASKEWKETHAKELEAELAKRAVSVKLKLDGADNLKDIQKKFEGIHIDPISTKTKASIQSLAKDLNGLADALKNVSRYSTQKLDVNQQNFNNFVQLQKTQLAKEKQELDKQKLLISKERTRQSEERLRQAEVRLRQKEEAMLRQQNEAEFNRSRTIEKDEIARQKAIMAQEKHNLSMRKGEAQLRLLNNRFKDQEGIVERLGKRAMVYASFYAIGNFINNVRRVTAEFELQRVSLGAIIQDQNKANRLFGDIKSFAVKSPLNVMELTDAIKRVAAYRIETDKLFDTTKRLADVSVGLGVEMGRLVLAYGQVKAASYLRAAEIRQFTEAGLPMLELLSEKFTLLQGKAVSTGEVMEMVSNRMVSFRMVEEIFEDLTSKGGMFYNMQEKQSETLFGMWAKLGDSLSIMYDEMGRSESVNKLMKDSINYTMELMQHWEVLATIVKNGIMAYGVYKLAIAGLLPYYQLQNMQIMQSIKIRKMQEASSIRQLSMFVNLDKAQRGVLYRSKQLTQEEWREYITTTQLNRAKTLRLAQLAKEDTGLRRALISLRLYNEEQLKEIGSMSKGQFRKNMANARIEDMQTKGAGLMGLAKMYAPLIAITAVVSLITELISVAAAKAEAFERVQKKYADNANAIEQIRVSYEGINVELARAGKTEKEIQLLSYDTKIKELEKIVSLLKQFGQYNVIDLSVINHENIDATLSTWINRLKNANTIAKNIGLELADKNEAIEWNGVFGENLKSDMKDWKRAWVDITANKEFDAGVEKMQNILKDMKNSDFAKYQKLSGKLGIDAEAGIGSRHKFESELQYRTRLLNNYGKIWGELNRDYSEKYDTKELFSVGEIKLDFIESSKEIESELENLRLHITGKDAFEAKIAIDTAAAEQGWEDWQKEYVIDFLNRKPRVTINAEVIPFGENDKAKDAMQGMKAILNSEFQGLFTEQELQGMGSMSDILEQIRTKGEDARKKLAQMTQMELNGSQESAERRKKVVEGLQAEIKAYEQKREELERLKSLTAPTEADLKRLTELSLEMQDYEPTYLEDRYNKVNAILLAEEKITEEMKVQKTSLMEQIKLADEALKKFSNEGLSTLAVQVKNAFSGLMVDELANISNLDYSDKGLFSNDDLKRVKDKLDLQDVWRQKYKEVISAEKELAKLKADQSAIDAYNLKIKEKDAELSLIIKNSEEALIQMGREKELKELKDLAVQLNVAKTEEERNKILKKRQGILNNLFATNAKDYIVAREQAILEKQGLHFLSSDNKEMEERLKNTKQFLEEMQKLFGFTLDSNDSGSKSTGDDPWITLIKDRMKYMQDFQKETKDLQAFMGKQTGLFEEQMNMLGRGKSLGIDSRSLQGTESELIDWYEDTIVEVQKKIVSLGGKEWEGIGVQMILGKDTKSKVIKKYQELLQELFNSLTGFRTDKVKREMEEKIKKLSEEVKRTKVVQEFFKNTLDLTGDVNLASSIADAIYGNNGSELFKKQIEHIKELFKGDVAIDLSPAIDINNSRIDYLELERIFKANQDNIIKNNRDTIETLISDGQKLSSSEYLEIKKRLAKAKDYEEQRTDIVLKAKAERDKIIKMHIPEEEKQTLLTQSRKKEKGDLSSIDFKELTESEYYVKAFQDLGNVTYDSLGKLKTRLEEIIEKNKDLTPQNVKTLADAIQKIDNEMQGRIFGGGIWDNFKKITEAQKALEKAKSKRDKAQSAYNNTEPTYDSNISKAKQNVKIASDAEKKARQEVLVIEEKINKARAEGLMSEEQINTLVNQKVIAENALVTAQLNLNNAKAEEDKAIKEKEDAQKRVEKSNEQVQQAQDQSRKASNDMQKNLESSANKLGEMATFLGDVKDLLGISSDTAEGVAFDAAISGLQTMQSLILLCTSAMTLYTMIGQSAALVTGGIMLGLAAVIGTITFFVNNKARKLENKIQDIKDRVEEMEHAFDRLEKAQNKAFGADYISNYQQRLRSLQAQQTAYARMAEYEKQKGKKADKEKVDEYLRKSQEATDKILDMQSEISEKMTETDVSSSAKDFAKSWLNAYLSFANTTDAIKGKFKELIRNMIVNSLLAKVVQMQLQPIFDMIDNLAKDGDLSASDIAKVFDQLPDTIQNMSVGMETIMQLLSKAGINVRDLTDAEGEMKGIARDVSSASESSINGLAAGINTQNHHISYVPNIAREVSIMRAIMESGAMPNNTEAIDISKQSLANLQAINRNTAITASEVKNMYSTCLEILGLLGKTIKPRGIKASHTINTSI